MSTDALRATFLIEDLFVDNQFSAIYSHNDRIVLGGAKPLGATVVLEAPAELGTDSFFEAREAGFVNVGMSGRIEVDGEAYSLDHGDCLYVGAGATGVSMASDDPSSPAKFYVFSTTAHRTYPTRLVRVGEGNQLHLGDQTASNVRTINQYIHNGGVQSSQLVLGVTTLAEGNLWNTMPAHTHDRRTECYLYFDLPQDQRVVHLMGEPEDTRHLIVGNEEAVISPSWSIHSGVGTASYSFVWAMAGENKDYGDVVAAPIGSLR